jgi:2-polyprenyl-3-methyl-5-hydroxy-6-metoxy-1,4-benzoquinol methylase
LSIAAAQTTGIGAHAYADKDTTYFNRARNDFVARLPKDPTACILEVGCGTGATGELALSTGRCGHYVGIELFETAATEAREVLSEVHVGDVEHMQLPWRPAMFDALIMSEVLEHLIDPGHVLRRLAPLVRPGGMVLASSPNISQWRVIRELLAGRFDLADKGVFDRTHMRWFTPATFVDMFEHAGYAAVSVGPVTPFAPRTRALSVLTGGRLDHLFMTQISFEGRKR